MVTRTVGVVSGATCLTFLFSDYAPTGTGVEATAFLTPFSRTFTTVGVGLLGFLFLTLMFPRVWLPQTARPS
jgi:hypothetical protein